MSLLLFVSLTCTAISYAVQVFKACLLLCHLALQLSAVFPSVLCHLHGLFRMSQLTSATCLVDVHDAIAKLP